MIGATLDNRYRIDAELGWSGMGVVYRDAAAMPLAEALGVARQICAALEAG